MKYVVVENEEGKEEIFIFPRHINHDDYAETISYIKRRDPNKPHDWWERGYCKPISAGFFSGGKCSGRSETLGLDSRGEQDERLITG